MLIRFKLNFERKKVVENFEEKKLETFQGANQQNRHEDRVRGTKLQLRPKKCLQMLSHYICTIPFMEGIERRKKNEIILLFTPFFCPN